MIEVSNNNLNKVYCLLCKLERRVDITRKIRIQASRRLNNEYVFYKKLNYFYTTLIVALSILYIDNANVTNILLAASISVTFFSLYISDKNLQQRSYKMEVTYHELTKIYDDILLLKSNPTELSYQNVSSLYDSYETILIAIENHENIDYIKYVMDIKNNNFHKSSCSFGELSLDCEENKPSYLTNENYCKKELAKSNFFKYFKSFIYYVIPIALVIVSYFLSK